MVFHDVYLLRCKIKLSGLGALVSAIAGFLVFKWLLCNVLFRLVIKLFAIFGRATRAMQHACRFCTGHHIAQMECISFLAISSSAFLWVLWRGGSSSLFISAITRTVSFCLLIIFEGCSSFVYCLCDFHALKHFICLLVGPFFKIPSFYVGLHFTTRCGRREGESC